MLIAGPLGGGGLWEIAPLAKHKEPPNRLRAMGKLHTAYYASRPIMIVFSCALNPPRPTHTRISNPGGGIYRQHVPDLYVISWPDCCRVQAQSATSPTCEKKKKKKKKKTRASGYSQCVDPAAYYQIWKLSIYPKSIVETRT